MVASKAVPAYLDHAATTPILPSALAALNDAYAIWANPSSPHADGRRAKAALEGARARLKSALGWDGDVIFTAGATESIAIAVSRHNRARVLAGASEHDAVLRHVRAEHRIALDERGLLMPDGTDFADALVCVQHVNSETGVIQPVDDIAATVRAHGGMLLCDCAQSAGKMPLPDADLIAIGGHKFGGPVGIGALLVRDLTSIRAVGGQELGYRAGTENVPAILAMVAALEADRGWLAEAGRLRAMLDDAVLAFGGEIVAADSPRIATIASYRLPGISARAQLIRLDAAGFAVSAGSACSSGSLRTSHVLAAMGWQDGPASEVVRVSFGWTTTAADVAAFIDAWRQISQAGRG